MQSPDDSRISDDFKKELKSFVAQIESLKEALIMSMVINQTFASKAFKAIEEFEKEHCIVDEKEDGRHVSVPVEQYNKWKRLKHRCDQSALAAKLIPRSILVSLHSQFDAFLGRILRLIFIAKPELLNPSNRQITFSEVVEFSSIDAVREHIINKEIENLLRESRADQFEWMEKRFSTPLTRFDSWSTFIEVSQRRNLFVHTDGIVSRQYLEECKNHKCAIESELSEGDSVGVPHAYFEEAASCIIEVGVKLAQVLWRKFMPDQSEEADDNLNGLAYDLIDHGEYKTAIKLLEFAVEFVKRPTQERKMTFIVNLAQAYKWDGEDRQCERILSGVDWSALGDKFVLAEAVLREDWSRAIIVMRRVGSGGGIDKHNYRDWPLFRQFRKKPEFTQAYSDIFGDQFPINIDPHNSALPAGEANGLAPTVAEPDYVNTEGSIL